MGKCSPSLADNHKEVWKAHRKELKGHINLMQLPKKEDVFINYPESYEPRDVVAGITVHEGWACEEDEGMNLSTDLISSWNGYPFQN
jgi:hypothetical protein